MMKILAPLCLVILAAVMESAAIKCYVCDSNDNECLKPGLHNKFIPHKDPGHTTCYETHLNIGNETTGIQTYVTRGGIVGDLPHGCIDIKVSQIKANIATDGENSGLLKIIECHLSNALIQETTPVKVCTCKTEFCNDNSMLFINSAVIGKAIPKEFDYCCEPCPGCGCDLKCKDCCEDNCDCEEKN